MIIDGKLLKEPQALSCDLCILGLGVAGTVLANELHRHYDRIIVIESGSEEYDESTQRLYEPAEKPTSFFNPKYSRLRMMGGSSNHWENNTSPFDPIDFEKRPWIEHSGWPISFQDVEPYYKKAAVYCGTGDDGYDATHWSQQLQASTMTGESKKLATGIAKRSLPPVRFFKQHGHEIETSQSVHIYKNSNLVDLDFDANTETVDRIYFESTPGLRHSVSAKKFVLCLGGIENARMLLYFNQAHDNKLGNTHDQLGRYFMDHPVVEAAHFFPKDMSQFQLYRDNTVGSKTVTGYLKLSDQLIRHKALNNLRLPLIPQTNYYLSDGVSSFNILKNAARSGEMPNRFGTHILNMLKDIDLVAEGISRKSLKKSFVDDAKKIEAFMIYMMVEQTPHPNNRIKLSDIRDPFNIPRVLIDWQLMDEDKEQVWRTLDEFAQAIGELDIGRVKILRERADRIWGEHLGFGHHHMGTTRMATSAKKGVVDANSRLFGTQNVYVGGSSVFPTGGHVPPTLTITAMSIRLAEHLTRGAT